ncbi:hypothetical protein NC653_031702 [Populus alba x Populus x berolinensis]|nr:hypothetical protein NC653_031702 [Populus alba x Populus x berolinensis]
MSSASKAWAVAASIAAVEALKDQGFCRWNYTIRSLHQHAKNQLRSFSLAKKLSSQTSTAVPGKKMSSTAKAWAVATSNAAVEALKDQGFCGWNHTIRSLHQPAKNQVRSTSKTRKLSSPPSTVVSSKVRENHKAKQSEESMRKVMYLSSWGPYYYIESFNMSTLWNPGNIHEKETTIAFSLNSRLKRNKKCRW